MDLSAVVAVVVPVVQALFCALLWLAWSSIQAGLTDIKAAQAATMKRFEAISDRISRMEQDVAVLRARDAEISGLRVEIAKTRDEVAVLRTALARLETVHEQSL